MQIDTTKLTAEVYAINRDSKTLYIKVAIPSLLMYINSCTVMPSQYGGLWFQMPKFKVGSKWIKPIEFDGASEFLDLLKDEAMRAADRYIWDNKLQDLFPGAEPTNQDGGF
jgi:hypothetical protein